MKATEAREIATKVQESGLTKILEDVASNARLGRYSLSYGEYTRLTEPCQKLLREMGYNVKWKESGFRDDGYWEISW